MNFLCLYGIKIQIYIEKKDRKSVFKTAKCDQISFFPPVLVFLHVKVKAKRNEIKLLFGV